jgi:DNA-binding transcriptional MerR regulator
MKKQLSQITFDFGAVEELVPQQATVPVIEAPAETAKEVLPVVKEKVVKYAANTPGKRGRKSLKDASAAAELVDIPSDEELFKKQYYSIGAVATMFREKQSLIRYWETEFDILEPRKNRKGDRFFRPVDVKNLVMIYDLLRRRKFTIEGAKEYLKRNKKAEERFAAIQALQRIRAFLMEMKASL